MTTRISIFYVLALSLIIYSCSNDVDEITSTLPTEEPIDTEDLGDSTNNQFIKFARSTTFPIISLSDAEVSIVDEEYIHIFAASDTSDYFFEMIYPMDSTSTSNFEGRVFSKAKGLSNGEQIFHLLLNIIDTNFKSATNVGDTIIGFNSSHFLVDFNLVVDRKIRSASIRSLIWQDDNLDGIRDANEHLREDLKIVLFKKIGSLNMEDYISNVNIDLVIPGHEYYIRYRTSNPTQPQPTLPNEGSDDSFDSDFTLSTTENNSGFITSTFIPKEGEVIDSLHLGIKP